MFFLACKMEVLIMDASPELVWKGVAGNFGSQGIDIGDRRDSQFEPDKKAPKRAKTRSFYILSAAFPYIWPLAGPNIAEKGWLLLGKAQKGNCSFIFVTIF